MKTIIVMLSFLAVLFGCHSPKVDEVRFFIPGTYFRYSETDMRRSYDTLIVEVLSESGNTYRLLRSSSFQQILDGQNLPWRKKEEIWTAVYDETKMILNEMRGGKFISFAPEKGLLYVGTNKYKKLKQSE